MPRHSQPIWAAGVETTLSPSVSKAHFGIFRPTRSLLRKQFHCGVCGPQGMYPLRISDGVHAIRARLSPRSCVCLPLVAAVGHGYYLYRSSMGSP